MKADRKALPAALLLSAVAAATTWAALTAWRGFVAFPSTYLDALVLLALLLTALGTGLRWAGAPRVLTALAQTLLATALVSAEITGSLLPTPAALSEISRALGTAVESARLYAAPIGPNVPPVWPLLLVGGAVFLVLVDTIACTYRKVPIAGLALLGIYSVPSGLLDDGPDAASFALAALGFLLLLHLDAREHLLRWGRAIGPEDDSPWSHGHPVRDALRAGAGRIGITATVLALLLPPFIPVLGVDLFDLGTGSGDGDIRIRKPIADMKRDLERGEDRPLVQIRTDDPSPSYLRISVLNRYTGNEWSSGDRDVARDDVADGELPAPVGLSPDVPRRTYSYDVEITDALDSTWLPTQFPAAAVTAEGDWRFDPTTLDFLAADRSLDTRGMSYTMTGLDLDYGTDGRFFRDSQAGAVAEEVRELPAGVPPIARNLARSVTEPASNDYERALLLQRWFRQDGGFEYDLRRAPNGTGNGTLEAFLSRSGRVGYCEQYASAMAVMARTLGIPARVAVGFLKPDPLGGGLWEYSSHDLHAWPELYFADAGWVRFEPTPAGRAESIPDYSRVPVAGIGDDPTDLPSNGASSPGSTATVAPNPAPTRAPVPEDGVTAGEGGDDAGWPMPVVIAVATLFAVLLLVALAVAGPRSARERTRRTRLAGSPDEVWDELSATAQDLGVPWPDGRSPREVRAALVDHLADPAADPVERPRTGLDVAGEAADALDRVVLAVEHARYARPGAVATLELGTSLDADAALVVASLRAGVTPRERRRAAWLPRSFWRSQPFRRR